MKRPLILTAVAAAVLASAATYVALQSGEQDESRLTIQEFMGHVMQRNAEQLWSWTALDISPAGDRWTKPVSDEDWENAESDSLTLHQLAYTLEHSDYRIDDPRWAEQLKGLRAAAEASARAAETKDFDGLVRGGEAVNTRCVECHLVFAPQLEVKPPAVPIE